MSRAAREISESGRYHIMLRGINKQNIFENDEDKEKYMSILTEYKEKCGFEIYGFCLMSNHIHLLIKTGTEPLESIFKKTGSKYVYWYNRDKGTVLCLKTQNRPFVFQCKAKKAVGQTAKNIPILFFLQQSFSTEKSIHRFILFSVQGIYRENQLSVDAPSLTTIYPSMYATEP